MIDTHCHLDAALFDLDRAEVLARARAAGVTDLVLPATGPEGWAGVVALARSNPGGGAGLGVHAGLGIHPQALPDLDPRGDDARLADLDAALGRGGVVAIGECGLDGPVAAGGASEAAGVGEAGGARGGASMERQVAVLSGHLALARKHRLPVLLHHYRALGPLLALLERDGLPHGGVLHSFSGSAEQVPPFVELGLHFAFAGPLTWERARKAPIAARAVPRDRLLLETDAPDQTPRPRQGRNEPAFLPLVAAGLAAALGLTVAEVDALTSVNARRLFRLPPEA